MLIIHVMSLFKSRLHPIVFA